MTDYTLELEQPLKFGDRLIVEVREATPNEHDPEKWHPLTREFGHEHKHNPNDVNDIFGTPGAWFGKAGQEISYPWQTFTGAGMDYEQWDGDPNTLENVAKHRNYGWIVRRDVPANGRSSWISAFRLQVHASALGWRVRVHSFSLEAQISSADGQAGIIRTGGHLDYGNLEVDGYGALPFAGEEDAVTDTGRRRIHYWHDGNVEQRRNPNLHNGFFWYGLCQPKNPPFSSNPLFQFQVAISTADASNIVNPSNPSELILLGEDTNKNNSTIQAHVVRFGIKSENFSGFTDRYGKLVDGNGEIGVDRIPLIIENCPLGNFQYRDDTDMGISSAGTRDFDISPEGEHWIVLPN